jgi:hypothetical protein
MPPERGLIKVLYHRDKNIQFDDAIGIPQNPQTSGARIGSRNRPQKWPEMQEDGWHSRQ